MSRDRQTTKGHQTNLRNVVPMLAWIIGCAAGCSGSSSAPFDVETGGAAAAGGNTAKGGRGTVGDSTATGGLATTATGGNVATGGVESLGGPPSSGGAASNGGAATGGLANDGRGATGGKTAGGNSTGGSAPGGVSPIGGSAAGGKAAVGGAATGGASAGGAATGGGSNGGDATGGAAAGGAVAGCGTTVKVNRNPFNCKFGWGSSTQASSNYQNFITRWTGYETNGGLTTWSTTGTNNNCGVCSMVTALASTNAIPAFYTYWIGYQARVSGFGDCNVDMTDGHNLCTDGAAWILANWQIIVRAYAEYAKKVEVAAPGKASLWLLEGDLSQYVNSGQQVPRPLTWAELGQLVTDITCAIKSNHPNGMVYLNHSYWLSTATTTSFFGAMPLSMIDGMWMGGGANLAGKLTPATYTTVTYAWLHQLTGLPMYVGGQGASQQNWASATVTDLNARIADGVIAADIDPAPANAQTAIAGFATTLSSTCL